MDTIFTLGLIALITYLFSQFAKQEAVEEFYLAIIMDVEGRIDWAVTRSSYPFGMLANIELSNKLLQQARELWRGKQFHQAYRVARQSQKAIDKAQNIYISVNSTRYRSAYSEVK